MKTLLLSVVTFISTAALASPTILTGKKIECRHSPEGNILATFALGSLENQSNEIDGIMKTRSVRYVINTSRGVLNSQARVDKVTRPSVISVSTISYNNFDFEIKGAPYFRIVIEQYLGSGNDFKIETNLNVTETATGFRFSRSDRSNPMTYSYCIQTNENM